MDIHVWRVNPIAVATNKIPVHPDPLVHPVRPVPMENTVRKAREAKVDHKVLVKDMNVQRRLDAYNAHPDRKDQMALLDPLGLPVVKDNRVTEVAMDTKVRTVRPVRLVLPALPEAMVIRVLAVIMVPTPKSVAKALQVEKVKTAVQVPLVTKATTVPLVIQAPQAVPALPEVLAKEAKMEEKVNLVHLVNLAHLARMPNIVLVHIAANLSTTLPKFLQFLSTPTIKAQKIIQFDQLKCIFFPFYSFPYQNTNFFYM